MEINGQGFILRSWRPDDAASIQKHADNPNIYSFLMDRFPHPYTTEAAVGWVTLMLDQAPMVNFVIDVDGIAVGVIGLELRDDIYRKAPLLGYWLGEDYWGRGIMPGAVKLVVNYAFTHLDVIRIQAGILSNNPGSMRVLEKAGFTKEGISKNGIIKNGVVLDEHIYAILKEEM